MLTAGGSGNYIPYNEVASSLLRGDLGVAPPLLPHHETEFVNKRINSWFFSFVSTFTVMSGCPKNLQW